MFLSRDGYNSASRTLASTILYLLHFRDSLIVTFGNCLTSFFAWFVIFSFLGFLATDLNVEVPDIVDSGVILLQ